MIIRGKGCLYGGETKSYNDHRIAMSMSVAGLVSKEGVYIDNPNCADISFPGYFDIIERMMKNE